MQTGLITALGCFVLTAPLSATASSTGTGFDRTLLPAAPTDASFYTRGPNADEKEELGRLLFFDKILSGNRNIACATCHHPSLGTSDGVSLALGEGASGLGPERRAGAHETQGVHERIPRNAPALFNKGAHEFTRMFHDGRVETDEERFYEGGFVTPARWKLPSGLDNVLAAQAMFPVISPAEMAGQQGENGIADAMALNKAAGPDGAWEQIAARLRGVPEYVQRFQRSFPGSIETGDDITLVHAANAIAAFEAAAFRADNSPFDHALRGEEELDPSARRGMELFYGRAGCVTCHSGPFQTDHDFHAIAMPQIGPGKSDGWDASYWRATGEKAFPEDYGRGRVTAKAKDRYRFRTPSLRNVELTGPWGHDGAYDTLEAVVRHHLDPEGALESYQPAALPPIDGVLETVASGSRLERTWLSAQRRAAFLRRDTWVQGNPTLRNELAERNELAPIELTDTDVDDLVAFLKSLTDPSSRQLDHLVPASVPSGLPVED